MYIAVMAIFCAKKKKAISLNGNKMKIIRKTDISLHEFAFICCHWKVFDSFITIPIRIKFNLMIFVGTVHISQTNYFLMAYWWGS